MMRWFRRAIGRALFALPVEPLRSGDVIVVKCRGRLSQTAMQNIQHEVKQIWPNHRVVVIDGDTDLRVVHPDDEDVEI